MGIIREDRLDEINVNKIMKISLVEQGFITKPIVLRLDEHRIKGDRGVLKKSASILHLISLAVVVLPLFLTIFSALLGYTLHLVADSTSTVDIPD